MQRASKRQRQDDRKQELAVLALQQIQKAQTRALHVIYTDGSEEFVQGVRWIAGFGCHEPGFWEEAHPPPPLNKKQSINRAKLMAVITSVRRTHTHGTNGLQLQRAPPMYMAVFRDRPSNGERNNGSPAKAL